MSADCNICIQYVSYHNDNTLIQYTGIFTTVIMVIFRYKIEILLLKTVIVGTR